MKNKQRFKSINNKKNRESVNLKGSKRTKKKKNNMETNDKSNNLKEDNKINEPKIVEENNNKLVDDNSGLNGKEVNKDDKQNIQNNDKNVNDNGDNMVDTKSDIDENNVKNTSNIPDTEDLKEDKEEKAIDTKDLKEDNDENPMDTEDLKEENTSDMYEKKSEDINDDNSKEDSINETEDNINETEEKELDNSDISDDRYINQSDTPIGDYLRKNTKSFDKKVGNIVGSFDKKVENIVGSLKQISSIPSKISKKFTETFDILSFIDMKKVESKIEMLVDKFNNMDPEQLEKYLNYMINRLKKPIAMLSVVIKSFVKLSKMIEELELGKFYIVPINLFNNLLQELSPSLTETLISMLDIYAQALDKLGPKAEEMMTSFFDANTGVIQLFITKSVELLSSTITDLIKAIPVVGDIYMVGNKFIEGGVAFVQIFHKAIEGLGKAMNGFICGVESLELFSCLIRDNIGALKNVFNSNVDIILRISNMFSSIIPDFAVDKNTIHTIYMPVLNFEQFDILSWIRNIPKMINDTIALDDEESVGKEKKEKIDK